MGDSRTTKAEQLASFLKKVEESKKKKEKSEEHERTVERLKLVERLREEEEKRVKYNTEAKSDFRHMWTRRVVGIVLLNLFYLLSIYLQHKYFDPSDIETIRWFTLGYSSIPCTLMVSLLFANDEESWSYKDYDGNKKNDSKLLLLTYYALSGGPAGWRFLFDFNKPLLAAFALPIVLLGTLVVWFIYGTRNPCYTDNTYMTRLDQSALKSDLELSHIDPEKVAWAFNDPTVKKMTPVDWSALASDLELVGINIWDKSYKRK